jgi:fission process protein 1
MLLALLSSHQTYIAGAARSAPALRRHPTMVLELDPSAAVHSISSLLAEEGAEPITPVFLAQLGLGATMFLGGTALETGAFGEVEEPKEVGVVEGEVDIYRDSPLRYMGYANECGEAFRPLVPVEVVFFTYFAAISYVLADTVDKGKKGAAVPGDDSALRATFGAVDTFLWQMLASVLFPSFIINRLVTLLFTLQGDGVLPEPLTIGWLPTAAGLLAIPLLIAPLDVLAHWTLNGSFRRVSSAVVDSK